MGQGAGAAAAAGANRGDRDAGGTGTGTPLFKSLFPLRDPAPARSLGWGRAWGARGRRGARPRRVQQSGLLPWRLRPRGMGG